MPIRARWIVAPCVAVMALLAVASIRVPVMPPPQPPGPGFVSISSRGAVPFTVTLNGIAVGHPDPCNGGIELDPGDPALPSLPWSIVLERAGAPPLARLTVDHEDAHVYVDVRGDQVAITGFPLSGPPPGCVQGSASAT